MKPSIVRIAAVLWVIGLVLTGLMLCIPPANVPLYIGLACISLIPLVFGSRRYQIFGIVAVTGSLMLAYWEYEAGLRFHAKTERLKLAIAKQHSTTNSQPSRRKSPENL